MTRVMFSCPHPTGDSVEGPGRPLTRVRRALEREFELEFYGPESFQEFVGETERLGDAIGPAFDDLVWNARKQSSDGVFLGGGGASLHSMQERHPRGTTWFSSHFDYAEKAVGEEYEAFGLKRRVVHPYVAWRARMEQECSDFMIVPSEACKATYPEGLQDKIRVAEFGVDSDVFAPNPDHVPGAHGGPLRVLAPMTNPPRKGFRHVLHAWADLPAKDFQLTVTGAWRGTIPLPPTAPPMMLAGWVSAVEMRRLYATHDILLLPSIEEGQALASLEALSCGLPVIVTPNVGLPTTAGFGWDVRVKSAGDIKDALLDAQQHRGSLKDMARAARAEALRRPWSKFEARIVEIVREEGEGGG